MNTATTEQPLKVQYLNINNDTLTVNLVDGRAITVPLTWYPRLWHGTPAERNHWQIIGDGEGIHWPDLDEDLSIEGIVLGRPSGESQRSFRRWLAKRTSPSSQVRPQFVPELAFQM